MADEQDPIAGDDFDEIAPDGPLDGEASPEDETVAAEGTAETIGGDTPVDEVTMSLDDGDATDDPLDVEAAAVFDDALDDASTGDGQALFGVLGDVVGSDADVLFEFGQRAGETLSVGLGSVLGKKPAVESVSGRLGEFAELETSFADRPHVSAEIHVAIDEAEIYSMAVVAPLDELGELFAIDTSPEEMADDEFARGQLEIVSSGLKEFLDLAGLMIFSDGLAGAEMTLGDVRLRGVAETVAEVATAAGEPFALHLSVVLLVDEGKRLVIAVAVPVDLVARLAALAGADERATPEKPPPSAPAAEVVFEAPAPPSAAFDEPSDRGSFGGGDVEVHPVRFPTLGPSDGLGGLSSMDLIMDVSLRVTVELGRSTMTVEEVLTLGPGSVIELNKLAGEPVDILVNDRAIARGEVVVVDENFGVRVTEILSPRNRIQAVGR